MKIGFRTCAAVLGLLGAALLQLAVLAPPAQAEVLVWRKFYDDASHNWDIGNDVAVSPDGSVYATGMTFGGSSIDMFLRKYSAAGVFQWMRTYNPPGKGWDQGGGVSVAPGGGIYVVGYTSYYPYGSTSQVIAAIALQKYSAAGKLLWTRVNTDSGFTYHDTVGPDVAAARDGVYVTGKTAYESGVGTRLFLRKYSPTGKLLWSRVHPAAWSNGGYGVAVSGSSVYVTGESNDNLVLHKYSSTGSLLWTRTYNGPAARRDAGYDVAVAKDGSVYVTGETYGDKGYSLLLRKYSSAGVLRWMKTFDGPGGSDVGRGLAAAGDGSVFVSGGSQPAKGEGFDFLLRKYTSTGTLTWSTTYGPGTCSNAGNGVAIAADNSVFVAGQTVVGKTCTSYGYAPDMMLVKYR